MRSATAILIAAVALAAPGAGALEVTTARDGRDTAIPFQMKLEATSAAMQAAYNDLLAKHNALLNSLATCANQKKLFNGTSCVATDTVPTGTVALFKTASCPTGWTRDGWWDNRFPYGASSSIGGTGGAATVKLNTNHLPQHSHTVTGRGLRMVRTADGDKHGWFDGLRNDSAYQQRAASPLATSKTGSSSAFSILPPYRRTLFCRKQ